MLSFLFRKKPKLSADAIAAENWKSSFGLFEQKRFAIEKTETYSSRLEKGDFVLELARKNHFAWVLDEMYRYNDFMLEAETSFADGDPYSALGFVFRYMNDQNFYYFLVSNKGYFRFDVVFNNNPMTRIDWTQSSLISPETNALRIIAHGSHFSFYIDDDWVAEVEDETLSEGQIGFAGQNYGDGYRSLFFLSSIEIESRPFEVEKQFERWVNTVPQEPEYRIALAKTFFTMSEFSTAAVQLRKALRTKQAAAADYFFLAEIAVNLHLLNLAKRNIEKCLELEPDNLEAIQEKANILYLDNRFLDARDYCVSVCSRFDENATFWNLYGNSEYSLGNWQQAFDAYSKAIAIQGDMPIFRINAARTLEMLRKKKEALKMYISSSKILFRQGAFDELQPVFARVGKIDPRNRDVLALQGEILFFDDKPGEAENILSRLETEGFADSAMFYILGLISSKKGEHDTALSRFRKACELEPSFHLSWLRAAETKHRLGEPAEEEIAKAYELAPRDPWVLNQYGLFHLQRRRFDDAKKYFLDALLNAPNEIDIVCNLSEAYAESGERLKAFSLLEKEEYADIPAVLNHKGNMFVRLGLDPENPVYLENCARACIELDMILRAEEILLKLFDLSPTPSVYNLIGYLAIIKREWVRAEIALREGLALDPENAEIKCNLASLSIDRLDYARAKQYVHEVLDKDPANTDALRILERIRESFEIRLSCAQCGREWWAPKNIPPQPAVKLVGEPPADAPAGKCGKCGKIFCVACAEAHLRDNRFVCSECDELLKFNDDWLKYLLMEKVQSQTSP
jgi:tetratricopeptide (TPR) repeat protein